MIAIFAQLLHALARLVSGVIRKWWRAKHRQDVPTDGQAVEE